jgi:protocatechuate 3,4-dioxygenase beta subunit
MSRLAALALVLTTALGTSAPPRGEVRGVVSDPDGKPLAGATIRLLAEDDRTGPLRARGAGRLPAIATSGEDGAFRITGLQGSKFAVRVEADGFAPSLLEEIPAGATLRVRLKKGVPLAGEVYDLDARRPLPGASVRAWDPGATRFGKTAAILTTADENGRFRFENLPPGSVRLDAWAPGKAVERLDDVVVEAPREDATPKPGPSLYLRPGARLAGRVVDGTGKPVAEARVSLELAGGFLAALRRGGFGFDTTDASGRFAFEGVPVGTRTAVVASKEGFAQASAGPFTVETGRDRTDLELRLGATASLAFVLKDENDRPVTDVEISLADPDRGGGGRRARLGGGRSVPEDRIERGEEGVVRAGGLDPGVFDLTVVPWGFEEIERPGVRLEAGETRDLGVLRAKEGTSVSGKVLDPEGRPIAEAQVFAMWTDGERPRTRGVKTRADGSWKVAGLGETPLRQLRASARGYASEEKSGALPGERNVDFVLKPAGVVLGRVLLPDGSAPPAFRVKVHEEARSRQETGFVRRFVMSATDNEVFTDPSGNFRLDTVEPGTVTLEATAEGWAPARKSGITVESGREVEAGTLVLDPGRTLRGRVLDAKDDAPLPGAVVSLVTAQGPMGFRFGATGAPSAVSDLGGVFTIGGLESRAYTAVAEHPDFAPYQAQVEVPAEEDPPELVVRLGRGGILTGSVRDASRQPVEGATILAMRGMMEGTPQDATTGPDGVYRFERLAPGTYQVVRTPSGDRIVIGLGMRQAVVREGETTVLDFDEKAAITLRGRVIRGGKPLGGVTLIFAQGTGAFPTGAVKTAQADAEGRYEVGLDAAGTYSVIVRGDLFARGGGQVEILVPEGPESLVDIVLKSGTILGRVVDASGEPVAGAIVSVRPEGAEPSSGVPGGRAATRSDGTFSVETVEPGRYRVSAQAAGYRTGEIGPVEVRDGEETSAVEIRLEAGRELRGRVVDPRGGAVAGASVIAAPAGSLQRTAFPVTTDVNGAFILTAPSDGGLDVVAIARGYAPARASGVVPDDSAEIVLRVSAGGRIRVRVIDGAGAAVAGARVTVAASPPYPGSDLSMWMNGNLVTGPDGTALATGLAPGSYAVTVEMGGKRAMATATVAEGGEAEIDIRIGDIPR